MIALDLQQETPATATPIIPSSKQAEKQEGVLSFSALLKGIKEGDKTVQNGALVLALDDAKESKETENKLTQKDLLSALLVEDEKSLTKEPESVEIHPQTKSLITSVTDFKQLIQDAKAYLKDKIVNSEGFKRAEIEKLPKTLKGLMQAAKKIGIDLSKITLEEVRQQGTVTSASQESEDLLAATMKKSLQKKSDGSTNAQEISSKVQHKESKKIFTPVVMLLMILCLMSN